MGEFNSEILSVHYISRVRVCVLLDEERSEQEERYRTLRVDNAWYGVLDGGE